MPKLSELKDTSVNDYHGWADGVKYVDYVWLLKQAEKAEKFEEALIRARSFSNQYTTANNFENVDPELVANEVFEITNNALNEYE